MCQEWDAWLFDHSVFVLTTAGHYTLSWTELHLHKNLFSKIIFCQSWRHVSTWKCHLWAILLLLNFQCANSNISNRIICIWILYSLIIIQDVSYSFNLFSMKIYVQSYLNMYISYRSTCYIFKKSLELVLKLVIIWGPTQNTFGNIFINF
jgi:hypothetical protein